MDFYQELVTERVKLHEENKTLLETAAKEKRTLTVDEQTTFDRRDVRMVEIKQTVTRVEKDREEERAIAEEAARNSESRGRKTATERGTEIAAPTREEMNAAFRAWAAGSRASDYDLAAAKKCGFDVRRSEIDMAARFYTDKDGAPQRMWVPVRAVGGDISEAESRSLTIGVTTAGGNAVPDEAMRAFSEALKWYGRVEDLAEIVNTGTGGPLPWPTFSDTANSGRVLAEETAATTTTDPVVNLVTLGAFKLSSDMVLASWELLQDSFVDLNGYLGRALGTRLGRIRNTKFTVGAGTTEPKGVIPCAGVGVTAAATNAFTMDEVIDLIHSLDPAYRSMPGTGFMAHDTVLKTIRKFKDGSLRYLWEPATQLGQPDRIYGYPVTPNNDMSSSFATGQKLVFFGNIKMGFVVRHAGAVTFQRLEELFARTHQVAYEAIQRSDSNGPDALALKVLALA